MLPTYDSLDKVPEALREHYELSGGKYIPKVSDDHPLVVNNRQLLKEKGEAETKAADLQTKLDSASANSLPRGTEAMPKADADLARAVKEAGIATVEAFTTMKDEHAANKTKVAAQERRTYLDNIRKAEGWGDGAVDVLQLIQDLPDVELRDTDEKDDKGVPKKKAIAKVKSADNVITEKPFAQYFAERHSALLPSVTLKAKPDGTPLPEHGAGGGGGGKDPVDTYIASTYSAPKPRTAQA